MRLLVRRRGESARGDIVAGIFAIASHGNLACSRVLARLIAQGRQTVRLGSVVSDSGLLRLVGAVVRHGGLLCFVGGLDIIRDLTRRLLFAGLARRLASLLAGLPLLSNLFEF